MLTYLLNPFLYVLVLILLLWIRPVRKGVRVYVLRGLISFLLFYLFSTPFLLRPLIVQLEDSHPPIDLSALDTSLTYHIIVLGAGHSYDQRLPATSRLGTATLLRLVEGIRIYRELPHALLITSAGGDPGRESQAKVAAEAAVLLGVAPSHIHTQETPHNTETEASAYVSDWGGDHPLIIVTSARHMARAVAWFRKKGVENIFPAPTAYVIKKEDPFRWKQLLPELRYFSLWQSVIKEYLGRLLAK